MGLRDLLCAAALGVLEGVTEWLPVSSTGHLILLGERLPLAWSAAFRELFLVGVQVGAILAVLTLYGGRLLPFARGADGAVHIRRDTLCLWGTLAVAALPAAVVGVAWGETLDRLFYHSGVVAVMLIALGLVFLVSERITARISVRYSDAGGIPLRIAGVIGLWQVLAAVFPGTSRSGATLFGGMLCGVSRPAAAEFTFLLGVPVMLGAGALSFLRYDGVLGADEWGLLLAGAGTAFVVSLAVVRSLVAFLRRRGLAAFGWYRILLGSAVLADIWL